MPRYKQAMKEAVMDPQDQMRAGDALRQELARGDVALSGVAPVLSHLLASPGQALVSEDVLARMRGMLGDLARQVIAAHAEFGEKDCHLGHGMQAELAARLAASGIVVSHCYAIAMESQLGERLEQGGSIDQVLTPLLQELIASPDESTAELAMATMSAQARFVQAQRRMDMPLGELPSELFLEVLALGRKVCAASEPGAYDRAEQVLRASYDESVSRLGLLTRLIGGLSGGIRAALDLEHAGLALFATALARTSRQARELAILSCHERQLVRLALALRSGGLKSEEIARQFVVIHRDLAVPQGIVDVAPEEAVALLKGAAAGRGS
ncbi:hypothetical protein [Altererythrobacter litoralis]|uniref:DUF2336 domain-containing protein n=1 Tax=Altererythrobacter litoralis TaxID=3113904 RepID=A0ABU7GBK2_9SPHN|nr:hypothetical protein [Erythrobacteraceae bacterium 1XM1-14]